ncbi:MAG TPA: hypothetical protein VM450_17375, partial [Thermomicrobiales bacterium]|nr:hypothetical protein [Thermomicrobiales bacterium]
MTTTVFSSSVTSDGTDAIFTYAASGDSLIVNAGVTLSSQGYVVFGAAPDDGVGLDDLHASIGGTLAGLGAFYAFGSSVELTVGSTGRLEAVASAVEASYDSSVSNHGVIHSSEGLGVYMDNVTDATVENWGSIYGDYLGVALYDPASVGSATIVNHGTIESRRFSAIDTGLGTTLLTNDGTILANKEAVHINSFDGLAPNTATIHNSGSITSARNYGIFAHSTTVEITNEGTIAGRKGSIYLPSSGADTVTNAGHLDGRAVLGGGGDVYHGENGWVTGAVWGQAGNDLLVGGASADVLSGGSGSDTVTGGAGADTLTGATGADIVSGGAGDDVFRFAATGDA